MITTVIPRQKVSTNMTIRTRDAKFRIYPNFRSPFSSSMLVRRHGRIVNNAVAFSAVGVDAGSWVNLPAPSAVTIRGRTYHTMQAMDR